MLLPRNSSSSATAEDSSIELAHRAGDLTEDLVGHRFGGLDAAAATALRAGFRQLALQALDRALARHLHQAKRREVVDGGLGMVAGQRLFQRAQHLAAMLGIVHVDEVDDDDAAQVAQPQLPRHRLCGLQVGAEHRLFQVALAEERTGVDVDGGHRLGLVDHQVAPRFQRHLLVQRAADLILHPEHVEDRAVTGIQLQLFGQHRHVLGNEGLQLAEGLLRVHLHLVHMMLQEAASRPRRSTTFHTRDR
ncbi:hypothetical protein G6F65_018766 [Rhizopus arrhizus]|nr:hypothetical protein G6F65_018766 [Rhizopus arrhizus]